MPHNLFNSLQEFKLKSGKTGKYYSLAALEKAGRLAREQPVDIDWLLNWARDYGGSAQATSLALRRLRFALGLPVVAGPVCRRPTGD